MNKYLLIKGIVTSSKDDGRHYSVNSRLLTTKHIYCMAAVNMVKTISKQHTLLFSFLYLSLYLSFPQFFHSNTQQSNTFYLENNTKI